MAVLIVAVAVLLRERVAVATVVEVVVVAMVVVVRMVEVTALMRVRRSKALAWRAATQRPDRRELNNLAAR